MSDLFPDDPTRTPQGLAGIDFPILLFDGDCGFCNAGVQWTAPRDRTQTIHYAPLSSPLGEILLEDHGLHRDRPDSIVFIQGGTASLRSEAAVELGWNLTFPWWFFTIFLWLIPRFLRDLGYDFVAANRHRILQKDSCAVPDPRWKDRILG